ncbi:Clp protease N-terminal domain-containing protein [Amycolatopsis sp. NPDC051372]|uniref:Clp protease N-terminal domain-containing protein n=1 Tax=Amycolatopsis sp. NPDC051372 TaxID=3155669 RepID=UPI00342AAEA2
MVVHAPEHARRLGHRYVGCEHLLLAVSSTDRPAADVLRERGITPDRVEEEIVRRVGLGGGARLFGDLDGDALAAVGIDLDAVRADRGVLRCRGSCRSRQCCAPWAAPVAAESPVVRSRRACFAADVVSLPSRFPPRR